VTPETCLYLLGTEGNETVYDKTCCHVCAPFLDHPPRIGISYLHCGAPLFPRTFILHLWNTWTAAAYALFKTIFLLGLSISSPQQCPLNHPQSTPLSLNLPPPFLPLHQLLHLLIHTTMTITTITTNQVQRASVLVLQVPPRIRQQLQSQSSAKRLGLTATGLQRRTPEIAERLSSLISSDELLNSRRRIVACEQACL